MYVQVKLPSQDKNDCCIMARLLVFFATSNCSPTCDQMVLTDMSTCVLNVLYVRNIALNKVNYSHSSWAFYPQPPQKPKKAHRKKPKHLYIYFSGEETLELMNMKKSQTLIWREETKLHRAGRMVFGSLDVSRSHRHLGGKLLAPTSRLVFFMFF